MDLERQADSQDSVSERELVDFVMRHWRFMSWTELLSPDVVLTLKPGAIGIDEIAGATIKDGMLRAEGRDAATRILKAIYEELRDNFAITTKLINGLDLVLAGNLTLKSGRENEGDRVVRLVVFITFEEEGKIASMSISQRDLRPVIRELRDAALSGSEKTTVTVDFSDKEGTNS
jgi:hypothetical protein